VTAASPVSPLTDLDRMSRRAASACARARALRAWSLALKDPPARSDEPLHDPVTAPTRNGATSGRARRGLPAGAIRGRPDAVASPRRQGRGMTTQRRRTPYRLVLLRHGESEWNELGLFTGWTDVGLSARGELEARRAGELLAEVGVLPDVVHTSVLDRAIRTAELALRAAGRPWIPVRRSWRLNERHYGALQGRSKNETRLAFGDEQFMLWRRSYDVPPPPVEGEALGDDPRYRGVPADVLPRSECLQDVVARVVPYWVDAIVPDLRHGEVVLVAAHGNSLRALVKHLDGIGDDDVAELNLPTGVPLLYELGRDFRPARVVDPAFGVSGVYLDPAAATASIAGVKTQGRAEPGDRVQVPA
jgi:2,3-bisphosphoglycerate-dependent phosphoglycerate mutase